MGEKTEKEEDGGEIGTLERCGEEEGESEESGVEDGEKREKNDGELELELERSSWRR